MTSQLGINNTVIPILLVYWFILTVIYIIIDIVLKKSIEQNIRIEILSKRTTRDKLLAYFSFLSNWKTKRVFTIPFSYTDLADYLGIDRSAMMREIKTLKEDGVIKKLDKNRFTLLIQ